MSEQTKTGKENLGGFIKVQDQDKLGGSGNVLPEKKTTNPVGRPKKSPQDISKHVVAIHLNNSEFAALKELADKSYAPAIGVFLKIYLKKETDLLGKRAS